jgi:hypothetical protein
MRVSTLMVPPDLSGSTHPGNHDGPDMTQGGLGRHAAASADAVTHET